MGVAMAWVMLFHSKLPISNEYLSFVAKIGYGGVDVFLLLSGLGIFFSLDKDSDIKTFYKRRALRILPYYLPIILLFSIYLCIAYKVSPSIIFYKLTTLSFWLNFNDIGYEWYIPSLLGLYLISPYYIKCFIKKPVLITIIFSFFSVILSILIYDSKLDYLLIFTTRLPIYFMGILVAYFIKENKKLSVLQVLIIFLLFIIGGKALHFILDTKTLQYGLLWYPFILIIPFLLVALSSVFSIIKRYTFPMLTFLGKYSLVIYLLHEKIINYLANTRLIENVNTIVFTLIILVLTLSIAYFYQNVVEKIIKSKAKKSL